MNTHRNLVSTAAKRAAIIKRLADMCTPLNATIISEVHDAHELYFKIKLGPYNVSEHLEGRTRNTAFVLSWFVDSQSSATFPPRFAWATGAEVNSYHRAKATGVYETVDDMVNYTREGLILLAEEMKATQPAFDCGLPDRR